MTSTLLDQGDGYLKMKKLRKKEQEKSIIMKENKEDKNNKDNNNTAYKEGFVESMNNSNNKNILAMNDEESDTFNRLKSEFDSAMSTYASIQKSIHNESLEYVNQDKNKLQKNYFAREVPDAPSEDDIKYEGCWRDRSTRALSEWKGYMSKEQCAQSAADSGKSVFALQYGNTNASWWQRISEDGDPSQGKVPGKGYCFVGDTMTQAKRYGEGYYRRWRWALSWQNGYKPGKSTWTWQKIRYKKYSWWGWRWKHHWKHVKGESQWQRYRNDYAKYGVYLSLTDNGRIAIRKENHESGQVGWHSGNKETNGKIQWQQESKTDSGGNDIKYMSGATYKECEDYCAADDNCKGFNRKRDMTDGCWVKHSVGNARGNNTWDLYTKQKEPINSFLIIQDDGNVVLYKGTGPSDKQGVLFSFGTNKNIWNQKYIVKNQKWLDKRKYSRNYITNDEFLGKGEFIASDNGLHVLYLWWDGNILIGSNYTRCAESNGDRVGGAWANSVYTIPKHDVSNLGKAFYKNEDGNKFAYMQKDIRYGSTYKLGRKNWNTRTNDLGWQWVKTLEQAKAVCNTDPKCAGFVYERVSEYPHITHGWNRVWKKSKDMWPYGDTGKKQSGSHAYCDTYLRDVKFDNNYSCNTDVDEYVTSEKYAEVAGQGKGRTTFSVREKTDSGGSDIKYMSGATYKECEDYCVADDNCKGFNRKRDMTDGCWIKYDVGRAKGNNSWDLYTKSKETPSGMDGVMEKNTACSIKRSTGQERHILEKKKKVLQQRITDIIKQMKDLTVKARKYNDTQNSGKEQRIRMIYEYEQIFKKLDQEEKDLEILNQQEEDEEYQLSSQNYRYISWSIVAILIMIATMKFMKSK